MRGIGPPVVQKLDSGEKVGVVTLIGSDETEDDCNSQPGRTARKKEHHGVAEGAVDTRP